MNWQPIETAPKDVVVMVYTPPQPEDWPDMVRIGFDHIDSGIADDYWFSHGESYEHFCCVAKPEGSIGPKEKAPYTHWMPLPAAPGEPAVDESFEDRISDWAHGDALDAARYRWLRDNATRSGVNIDIGAGVEISDTLDAAVDDAMRLTAAKESP